MLHVLDLLFWLFVCYFFLAFFQRRCHVSHTCKCGQAATQDANQCTGGSCALPPEQATSVPVFVVLCCVLVCSFLFFVFGKSKWQFQISASLVGATRLVSRTDSLGNWRVGRIVPRARRLIPSNGYNNVQPMYYALLL